MSARNVPAGYLPEGGLMVKYELAWDRDECSAVIIRSVHAGVSGPHRESPNIGDRAAAEWFAFDCGFTVAGPWTQHRTCDSAPLTSFKG